MKHSGTPASAFTNPKVRAQIDAQLQKPTCSLTHVVFPEPMSPEMFIRQRTKGPNKLEHDFGDYLRRDRYPGIRVYEQEITLVLANGVRYTPDFVIFLPDGQTCARAYETKGFLRDDAGVKVKVVAKVHPWCRFWLVKRAKKGSVGRWDMQVILP